MGLSLDLFGAILVTLWPSLGSLRLLLGCLGSLLVYLGLHFWVLLVYLGLHLGICWWRLGLSWVLLGLLGVCWVCLGVSWVSFGLAEVILECVDSVSSMSEFHEVWCLDRIGRVSGCGYFHIDA